MKIISHYNIAMAKFIKIGNALYNTDKIYKIYMNNHKSPNDTLTVLGYPGRVEECFEDRTSDKKENIEKEFNRVHDILTGVKLKTD
jgi:hypothetical protein